MIKSLKTLGFVLVLIVVFLAGYFVHASVVPESSKVEGLIFLEEGRPTVVSFEPFWKAWNTLNEKFVNSSEIENQEKVWGAIEGLANSYNDPYTVFLRPEDTTIFEEDISGNFQGVGMEIGIRDNILTVVSPLRGTPAERAGIKAGDKILAINGSSTSPMSVDEAVRHIRGEKGTTVTLTIAREGVDEPLEKELVRDVIEIPTVEYRKLDNGIFLINLFNFNAPSTGLFDGALREFKNSGYKKLILDLRNNPGGFLEAAVQVSSHFLEEGKVVVTEDFREDGEDRVHRSSGLDTVSSDVEVVVLINEGSASASEIVAGALKEHGIATLIGATTFGKGSVQELVPITRDTALKVTVAKWLTPDGNSISEGGLEPDIKVPMTLEEFEEGLDPQLDEAVEFLSNK